MLCSDQMECTIKQDLHVETVVSGQHEDPRPLVEVYHDEKVPTAHFQPLLHLA